MPTLARHGWIGRSRNCWHGAQRPWDGMQQCGAKTHHLEPTHSLTISIKTCLGSLKKTSVSQPLVVKLSSASHLEPVMIASNQSKKDCSSDPSSTSSTRACAPSSSKETSFHQA